ncbi:hypothetical protein DPX16_18025 [Anabarilius grahami]|uniref:Uncharacterized protein n=1 Tax=Anabarilius grahami TaxID=495550 RepID=A0A3N0XTI9_ANAGA|nr:hypothetical protein DPX16_18025 [Anabarilius grahami]
MLETVPPFVFKTELDNDGETQEEVTTCRMQQDVSERSTPTGEQVTLSGGEERRRVCSASHVSDGTPLFLLLPQSVPEQWHC